MCNGDGYIFSFFVSCVYICVTDEADILKISSYFHLALGDIDKMNLFNDKKCYTRELLKLERTQCSINNNLAEMYPNIIAALKILLTTPATVALAEPSFSELKRLVGNAFSLSLLAIGKCKIY